LTPKSLLTAPVPYPNRVVCGFGAAGRAGKLSSLARAGGGAAGLRYPLEGAAAGVLPRGVGVAVPLELDVLPAQLGCVEAVLVPGKAGNADDESDADDDEWGATARLKAAVLMPPAPVLEATELEPDAALPRRVLFLSRRTRVEALC
jgi:hypothetical protein